MIENLFNLVKEHAVNAIINNPAIPNERNDEAIADASGSILDGLKGAFSNGDIAGLMQMFSNTRDAGSNALAQNIQGGFMQNLVGKFGLDETQAGGIASSLIPSVLQNFVNKTNDPNDSSFDIQRIITQISGGKASGFDVQGLLNQFQGGNKGGGGLMDMVKGFMK